MYVAKLETKTNLYLDTTAKLVPEQFSFETKSFSISGRLNEVNESNPCLVGISTS